MMEAEAFLTLPLILEGLALSKYDSTVGKTSSAERVIFYWPESLQESLRNYGQTKYITTAAQDHRNSNQMSEVDEK